MKIAASTVRSAGVGNLGWTVGSVLHAAAARLGAAMPEVEPGEKRSRARFEATYLLAGCLGAGLAEVAALPERCLGSKVVAEFWRRVERRIRGEPLQYIEGRAAFRELMLRVDPRVLIPRPETEQVVEQVLLWARDRWPGWGRRLTALDVGTGSGAIALSLALEGPFDRIVAVDISSDALNVAEENARETGLSSRVEFRQGHLFQPLDPGERFDVVVSNPPYVALGERERLATEVRAWEPPVALFAGSAGTEVVQALVADAPSYLIPGGLLAVELAPSQASTVRSRLERDPRYDRVAVHADLASLDRIVLAERAEPEVGLPWTL